MDGESHAGASARANASAAAGADLLTTADGEGIQDGTVAPGFLRLVKGPVGDQKQILVSGDARIDGIGGDSLAGGDPDALTLHRELLRFHGLPDPLRQLERGRPAGGGEQDHELVASVAGDQIRLPGVPSQDLAELPEDFVSAQVAMAVVDRLVMVEI